MHKQKPGIFETLPANISCFPRRLQRNTFCLPRPLENVLKTYLQYVFLKYLQDVFKTFSRRVCKTSCNYVLKTSWKTKKYYSEDVLKTFWRRLQYVFTKTNICWALFILHLQSLVISIGISVNGFSSLNQMVFCAWKKFYRIITVKKLWVNKWSQELKMSYMNITLTNLVFEPLEN